ncbi:hypothetical protein [Paraburkholderia sp. DHOC27]|uniref:hypothetical protein n=1 Tax=Paraburkholderia sp. DHOC27 TaxID=2303330 RepID=UPI000E3D1C40|nr:hypothetical protein [Paraburkholderia sp. DHOC27]RFU47321.1 hypothetical protein D0B32_14425 [Paraburkholderia sp. DHOC27]
MTTALDARGEEWAAEHYSKGKGVEPLRCPHCPTAVTHQSAYTCERHGKSIKVTAYFRLLKDGDHADGCPHAVEAYIKKLVAPSEGLIEALHDGKYRLRLMMVADALKAMQERASSPNTKSLRKDGGTEYQRTSGSLPAYVNSAKKVLLLRAACDDDNIAQHLELVFEGNTVVPWASFYYETQRYMEAYRALSLQTVKHPVALHGVVKSKRSLVIDGRSTNVVNLLIPKYIEDADDTSHGISVEASVWAEDPDWFDDIKKDSEVVVLGMWGAKAGKRWPSKEPGKFRFSEMTTYKLNLTLSLKAQIASVPTSR